MNTRRFEASQQLDLQRADADIAIAGWEQMAIELVLDDDPDQCQAERHEDTLSLQTNAALAIRVPHTTTVHIGLVSGDLILRDLRNTFVADTVHGDLVIRTSSAQGTIRNAHASVVAEHLDGALSIDKVHADVHLHNVAAARLGQAYGSVYAHGVKGTLDMGIVHGDVRARQVSGLLTLEQGQGTFWGHDLQGGMQLDHISGDLVLRTAVAPDGDYRARVRGAVTAWFPMETSARFILEAKGELSASLPEIETQEPGRVVGQAGAGQAEIDLEARGDLFVQVQGYQGSEFDAWATMDSISAQIEGEIAQHLSGMNIDAIAQKEIDKALQKAEQEIAKVQGRLEQERLRAQESAERAQERAARAVRRAQEKLARKSRQWGISGRVGPFLFGPTPTPPVSQRSEQGPSSEEQLAILKMLQENKITTEEAEALLAALGD